MTTTTSKFFVMLSFVRYLDKVLLKKEWTNFEAQVSLFYLELLHVHTQITFIVV